jgi:hypothetical protein
MDATSMVLGRIVRCSGGVLVGTGDGGICRHRPVFTFGLIASSP